MVHAPAVWIGGRRPSGGRGVAVRSIAVGIDRRQIDPVSGGEVRDRVLAGRRDCAVGEAGIDEDVVAGAALQNVGPDAAHEGVVAA